MDWLRGGVISRRLKGPWGLRKSVEMAVGGVIVAALLVFLSAGSQSRSALVESRTCVFPAVYNFGDSNSDTGSESAAFGRVVPPYGRTFFGRPSGRYSDGRLVIDFIAEKLGLPYLSAYLDSVGTNFRHGANFAASGSTIQHCDAKLYAAGFNPVSLDIQLSQFEQLKSRSAELQTQGIKDTLPKPEDFSRALYTMDSGQNDLHAALVSTTEEDAKASIPRIIDQFSLAVELLYKQGARAFWIHNTGPIGCLPTLVVTRSPKPGNADKNGCVKSYNEVAQDFNKQLKDRLSRLREQFQDATIIYVDIYSVKYSLISNAKDYGFPDPLGYCCGKVGGSECWNKVMENETQVHATACSDPSKYISWDGTHYTEAANKWVAKSILDGSFSEPRIPINEACHKSL